MNTDSNQSAEQARAWDEGWAARAEYGERRDVPTNWPDLNPYRPQQTGEKDAIYEELMRHQQVSTLHDWCTCGAGDRDAPLMDSGDSIRGFRKHLADVARGFMAQTWEECAKEAHDLGWLHDWALSDLLARNPYRRNPPAKSGGEVS